MKWQEITEPYKQDAAALIGMIDSGERWIFEHSDKDPDFHGFICNKVLLAENVFGVISAAHYRDCQRISIAFEEDLPANAETSTIEILADIVKATETNTIIWCKNENSNLRKIIEHTFHVTLNYASREMCVSKMEFEAWKAPKLPHSYKLCGFDAPRHDGYINLLERGMQHVSHPGTTPYLDGYDSLKLHFSELQEENRFHSLWAGDTLAGLCYSDGGEIDTLVVDEKFRTKGLGYYLLYTALKNAFIYHDGNMCLYVVDHNPGAYEFYQHCGMRVTGHSARYFLSGV